MSKKVFKRIIIIALCVLFLIVSCVFIFKRDFDAKVQAAAKECNNYYVDATFNSENMTIEASQKVEVVNRSNSTMNELFFHLYPRAFREGAVIKPYTNLNQGKCFSNGESFGSLDVLEVVVNGKKQDVCYAGDDENVLKIEHRLNSNEKVNVEMKFLVTIPNCNHRFGYMDQNVNLGNFIPILAHFDGKNFDLTPYYSTGDPFCLDVANFYVKMDFPAQYSCASTGNVVETKNNDKKQIDIEAKAVRDFAIVLSENFALREVDVGETKVKYYGYKNDSDLKYLANLVAKGLEFFNSKFGEYPYRQISVVKTPFLFGGMEYANLVMIADNIVEIEDKVRVIIHELAHQWWYGVVGNNQTTEAWVDESLTEYSSFLFFENHPAYNLKYDELIEDAKNTYDLYVDVIVSLGGKVNFSMIEPVFKYASEYEYSYMIYVKGTLMYDEIREKMGEKKFYKATQKLYKKNMFKVISKKDVFEAFSKYGGEDIKKTFNKYLVG